MDNTSTLSNNVWIETKTNDNKVYYYNSITKETTWQKPEHARVVSYDAVSQSDETIGKQSDLKPITTTAVPGTPWCIVKTNKNRVFYFNPSTKTSIWQRPNELKNREDVDKLVSNLINPDTQSATSENNQSPPSNQSRIPDEKDVKTGVNVVDNQSTFPKPLIVPKVVKKEVLSEVEKDAARKRETIPIEERIETFKKLLEEKEVDPSSTFLKELSKIVFDPRYLLLTSNERKETFEKYCLEKTESERQKHRERIKKATREFRELLKEARLSSHSRYDDFHSKYSKDPRYKALEKTKDREIIFDDYLASLRRKEREERSRRKRSPERNISPPSRRHKSRSTIKDNFRQLLKETQLIDCNTRRKIEESEHQHLVDIISTLQNDKRYLEMEPYSEERRRMLLRYIEELAASAATDKS